MVEMKNRTSDEKISVSEMPFYFRTPGIKWNTFIYCGDVKPGGNEPYCYPEEKQCANHICRVLMPDKTIDTTVVIRDDGTVWNIKLSVFRRWNLLKVVEEGSL